MDIINQSPTLLLKGLNYNRVIEKYNRGEYQDYKINNENQKSVKSVNLPATATNKIFIGDKSSDDIYSLKLKDGQSKQVLTTNITRFKTHELNGEKKKVGFRCLYCRNDYDYESLGVPVRISFKNNPPRAKGGPEEINCYMDGDTCGFECSLSQYLLHRHDPLYLNSEQILRFMYKQLYPGSHLHEAPDYRLLSSCGGSVTAQEYHKNKHLYVRTGNLVLWPVKVQYHQD